MFCAASRSSAEMHILVRRGIRCGLGGLAEGGTPALVGESSTVPSMDPLFVSTPCPLKLDFSEVRKVVSFEVPSVLFRCVLVISCSGISSAGLGGVGFGGFGELGKGDRGGAGEATTGVLPVVLPVVRKLVLVVTNDDTLRIRPGLVNGAGREGEMGEAAGAAEGVTVSPFGLSLSADTVEVLPNDRSFAGLGGLGGVKLSCSTRDGAVLGANSSLLLRTPLLLLPL